MGKKGPVLLIYAYDKSDFGDADRALLQSIVPYISMVKVGLEAMTAELPDGRTVASAVRDFARNTLKKPVMWDMKIKDIEHTATRALENIAKYPGVSFVTLHADMSRDALRSAVHIGVQHGIIPLAVTLLTDISEGQCRSRFGSAPGRLVANYAGYARKAGIRGIVCSPRELAFLKREGLLEGMTAITPGVRPLGSAQGDQKRIMTPRDAAEAGADGVVIGRPIRDSPSPYLAAMSIRQQLDYASTLT